jgi:hypothetical protein
MKHIPLKQYHMSKIQLLNAIESTPKTLIEYEIRKYGTIVLGESESIVQIKPKQVLIVEWVYDNPENPTPKLVEIVDRDRTVISAGKTPWTGAKLTKWLSRYAKMGINKGHQIA